MKRQIQGISEQIVAIAEKEFLEKGFQKASLRDIAQSCDVSTSSIYTRFGDKEGLFDVVVSKVIDELNSWFVVKQDEFHGLDPDTQVRDIFLYSSDKITYFVDYIYDHFTIFKLLTTKSQGTKYSTFINNFVDVDVQYTMKYIEATGSDIMASGRITPELLHILSSSLYTGIFETVIHDMPRNDAHLHVKRLRRFFMCGWKDVFEGRDFDV